MDKIKTERLILTRYCDQDEELLVGLLTDPDVMRFVDKGALSPGQAKGLWQKLMTDLYPRGDDTIWAIRARSDMRYIGNASIRPRPEKQSDWEISYYLRPDEWGKGYATDTATKLIEYGFGVMGLEAVFATVDPRNKASRRVLEKCGMSLYRKEYDEQGEFYVYRIKAA